MGEGLHSIIKKTPIIITCLILTYSPGCIENNNELENKSNLFEYILEINTTSEKEYRLIAPLVINYQDEKISNIVDQIKITGECTYSIKHTMYGPGINITGKGNVTIKSEGKKFEEYGILSLKYDSDADGILKDEGPNVEYWYYYKTQEKTTINLEIVCQIQHGSSSYNSELFKTEISSNGWNKANGEESIAGP